MAVITNNSEPLKKAKKKKITRKAILKAAIKVADKEGLSKLSMRNLAKIFRVEAMSLYNHVKNKEEILDGIVDLIFKEISWNAKADDWKVSMTERAHSTRESKKN